MSRKSVTVRKHMFGTKGHEEKTLLLFFKVHGKHNGGIKCHEI